MRVSLPALRSGAFALSVLYSTTLIPTHLYAQDVGGFINLLGNVIENDMRNQQERRRAQQQEQQYHRQQQLIRQAQQAEIDAQRRVEIALVKRMQAALSKLGYYSSKVDGDRGPGTQAAESRFTTAFALPQITLSEADIQHIEALARDGFRNRDEIQRAARGGFQTRDEMVTAEAGGFAMASEFMAARQAGFSSAEAFQSFKSSGFSSPDSYRSAKNGGFDDQAEFDLAKRAGFSSRPEYLGFVQSKLPDRPAFLKAQENAKAADDAGKQCITGASSSDAIVALDTCLQAVARGAEGKALSDAFGKLANHIEQRLSEMTTAPAVTEVASTSGTTSVTEPAAGDFLAERVALQEALRRQQCGSAVLSEQWSEAVDKCEATGSPNVSVQTLYDNAAERQLVAQQAADEELKRKQSEAAAEQSRLALAAAKDRLTVLIAQLGDFTQAKRTLTKPLDVAKAFVRLRGLQTSEDSQAIEQAILKVDELLVAEPDFQVFLKEKLKAQDIAAVNAKATALAEMQRTEAFIEEYVSRNMLAESVGDLLSLQSSLVEARQSSSDERIFNGQKLAVAEIKRLGLTTEVAGFVVEIQDVKPKSVAQAENGLAVTEGNRDILTGEPKDVLILGNFSAQAPHLVVNLLGKTTFENASASYCWLGSAPKLPLADQVLATLRELGAENLTSGKNCSPSSTLQHDIIVLPRGDFLTMNVLEARAVVEAFETQKLKVVKAIQWLDVGASAQEALALAQTIKTEVSAGAREGFGLVAFNNSSSKICVVVDPSSKSSHERALAINDALVQRHLGTPVTLELLSLDRAFAAAQKNNCRAIYAGHPDMKQLIDGAVRTKIDHTVLPIWIEPDVIEEGQALAQQSAEAQQKEIAARKQEIEARSALAEKQRMEAGAQREIAQSALRAKFSQEANAAFNGLSDLSETFLRATSDKTTDFPKLFPDIGNWMGERSITGWQFDKYSSQLIDYGTSDWKGRRLESVIVEISVALKNPVRGEYSNDCFVVGYLIDKEFNMIRDAFADKCLASKNADTWMASRAFESRWVIR